jgi:hypothetical protein
MASFITCSITSRIITDMAQDQIRNTASVFSGDGSISPIQTIVEAVQAGKLIAIIGAGLSIALTNGKALSWRSLLQNGFDYALKKGRLSSGQFDFWKPQLESSDIDDMLGAAEFISRKLGKPSKDQIYSRWLEESVGNLCIANEGLAKAIKKLSDAGVIICTLNYDNLLEQATGLPTILASETSKIASLLRRESNGILHLHGACSTPESCVLGIRDYAETQVDAVRDLFQRSMAVFNRLLFIGCGETLSDPNFSALIQWLRTTYMALAPQHFALVLDSDVAVKNADPAWAGFVDPLGYGPTHGDLTKFLEINFQTRKKNTKSLKKEVLSQNSRVIENYRAFLIRDCGQMAIEGVSGGMDTGQRKFDLEKLFVPLTMAACPPDFDQNDPSREEKLRKWEEDHKGTEPFGGVLARGKNLVLLALPGGGKTLLLKRLAVAYSNHTRMSASSDELPDLSVLPVLIRCRDWRRHITLPILTLLRDIGKITGQTNLDGFADAVVPLLKKGHVLLLVDGLDEIHNDSERATFVNNLEAFLTEYKKIRMVVTSREAGFNLVAPSLSKFCERWKIAPLEPDAITSLCEHWHELMIGETREAAIESIKVSTALINNSSLRRLAENPLLLTMLLVVKHGAGGLPPDRVSLYGRAVEVLLDTWNIAGHAPLNAREAVPQLSYVAYRLMCLGKQTVTEKELLALLGEARENLPSLKWYAKDSPHDFLKRVELRSSLLLEAGHQSEHGRTVPFYQFRHLTFQEYLTAVAVAEGNYDNYHQNDDVIKPLATNLLTEEWKEIIPMVAVLARKQAEPLMAKLVSEGCKLKEMIEKNHKMAESVFGKNKAVPVARLLQCLVEEAEASPKTLAAALELVVYFARGCQDQEHWDALCQGPYGHELYSYAWSLYKPMTWNPAAWLLNTCASIAARQQPFTYWMSEAGQSKIAECLNSKEKDEIGRGLMISMGLIWNYAMHRNNFDWSKFSIKEIEKHLFHDEVHLNYNAAWIWLVMRRDSKDLKEYVPPKKVLDQLTKLYLSSPVSRVAETAAYALSVNLGIDRDYWKPKINREQKVKVKTTLFERKNDRDNIGESRMKSAAFFISYHARSICTDDELLAFADGVRGVGKIPGLINRKAISEVKEVLSKSA